jgi:hypothetical protein
MNNKEKAIFDKAKKEIANINKRKEKFSWKKHNAWLDTFRGKIISKEYEEEEQRQKTINYAEKQNKKRKTS